ncbi:MAG: nitroreductase family protein [Eubacteriales bacterium]
MLFKDLAAQRYSVRTYEDKAVQKESIIQLLEAARMAPSAHNNQPWHFIVLTERSIKTSIATETYSKEWLQKAPVIIVVCGDHSKSWKRNDQKDHCDIDIAIAVDHITLAATEIGLGTCWVCKFDAKKCHALLDLPEDLEVIALLPIGYPADDKGPEKKRLNLEAYVSFEKYNG